MIVADSVGFAATHSIAAILRGLPDRQVTHGSRNFDSGAPMGPADQTPAEFIAAMERARARGLRPVAVHCLFAPSAIKALCEVAGVRYRLIVRDPVAQIESCYAWALAKILAGDGPLFVTMLQEALQPSQAMGIEPNLPNLLYLHAARHVGGFNARALAAGAKVLRMEELLSDEASFRAAFDIDATVPLPHFAGTPVHGVSHRAKLSAWPDALRPAEPARAAIRAGVAFELPDGRRGLDGLARELGY